MVEVTNARILIIVHVHGDDRTEDAKAELVFTNDGHFVRLLQLQIEEEELRGILRQDTNLLPVLSLRLD